MKYLIRPAIYTVLLFLTLPLALSSQILECSHDHILKSDLNNSPTFQKENQAYEKAYQSYMSSGQLRSSSTDEFLNLPIVFHFVHEGDSLGSPANPRDETVFQVVDYSNQLFSHPDNEIDYQNPNYGVDTEISFCVASEAPDGKPTIGIVRHFLNEGELFLPSSIMWDKERYINVLIREDDNNCGFYRSVSDYIFVSARCFPQKHVLAHELGHYLSLRHTFIVEGACDNQDCLNDGDFVCDTPPQYNSAAMTQNGFGDQPCLYPGNSCQSDEDDTSINNPYRSISLGGLGEQPDANNNVMSYAGTCVSTFTAGQTARMQFNLAEERNNLRAFASNCGGDALLENDVQVDKIYASPIDECGDLVNVFMEVKNIGRNDVESVRLILRKSNISIDNLNWTGLIKAGERVTFTIENVPTVLGVNHFEGIVHSPNGFPDSNQNNNFNFTKYSYENIEKEIVGDGARLIGSDEPFIQIGIDLFGGEDKFHFLWQRENGAIDQDQQGEPMILVSKADQYFLEVYSKDYACLWVEKILVEKNTSSSASDGPYIYCLDGELTCRDNSVTLLHRGGSNSKIEWYSRSGFISQDDSRLEVDSAGEYRTKLTHDITGEISYSDWYTVLDFRDGSSLDLFVDGEITCQGNEARIEAVSSEADFSDYTFIWKDLRDGERIISEGAVPFVNVSQPGRYGLEMYRKNNLIPCIIHKEIEVFGVDVPTVLVKMPEQFNFSNTDTLRLDATQSTQNENLIYQWSTDRGEILDGANSLNPLVRGYAKYTLNLVSTTGGCIQSSTIDLTPSHEISYIAFCSFSSTYAGVRGRYDYSIEDAFWISPNGEISNSDYTIIEELGTYTVTYFNGIDTIRDSITIDQNFRVSSEAHIEDILINCLNEEFTLSALNSIYSEGDIFIWRDDNYNLLGQGLELTARGSGIFRLAIYNENTYCTTSDSEEVEYVPNDIVAMAGPDIVSNCSQDTTIIGLNEEGDNIEFKWFYLEESDTIFISSTPTLKVERSGKYRLELNDQNVNCFSFDEVEVLYADLDIDITSRIISDSCLDYNAVLFVKNLENYFNYEIVWTLPNGETSSNFYQPAKQQGTYRVDYFSTNSDCSKSDIFNYTPDVALDIEIESQDLSCFGANDGVISAVPVGGISPYTWNNEDYDQIDLASGSYTYRVTDSLGCSVTREVVITEPSIIEVTEFGMNANELSVVISGGTEPYTYLWSTGSTQEQIQNPIFKEKYTVTVTDTNGCSVTQEIEYLYLPNTDAVILMPNPASDQIQIFIQSGDPLEEIKIYNTLGVCVQTIQDYRSLEWIDIGQWSSGVYIAVLSGDSFNQTIKFVKE